MNFAELFEINSGVGKPRKGRRVNLRERQGVVEGLFAIGKIRSGTWQYQIGHDAPVLGALTVYPEELGNGELQLTERLFLILGVGIEVDEILYGPFPIGWLSNDDAASIILYRA